MSKLGSGIATKILTATPAVVWLALAVYYKVTNHWGAFAIAPLLIPMFAFTAVMAIVSSVVVIRRARRGRFDATLGILSLIDIALCAFLLTR